MLAQGRLAPQTWTVSSHALPDDTPRRGCHGVVVIASACLLDRSFAPALVGVVELDLLNRQMTGLTDRHIRVVQVCAQHRQRFKCGDRAHCLSGLVPHHRMLFLVAQHVLEDAKRSRVLQLAQHVRKLMLQESRIVLEATCEDVNHRRTALMRLCCKTFERKQHTETRIEFLIAVCVQQAHRQLVQAGRCAGHFHDAADAERHTKAAPFFLQFTKRSFFSAARLRVGRFTTMAKTKRAKVVSLTRTRAKTRENKENLLDNVRDAAQRYSFVWVFAIENMRNTYLSEVRTLWEGSRLFFGKLRVIARALGESVEEEVRPGLGELTKVRKAAAW